MNPIDNAIVLDEAKRYTDKKMQNVLGAERINVLIDLPLDEGHASLERKVGLVAGTTYTVALDSGNYSAVCKRIDSNGESMLLIGNAALLGIPGMEDTGESFLIYEGYDSVTETYVTMVADAQAGTRCKVYETIRTIDPKFLPGVCLPVVELSGTLTTSDAVAEEDCAKLKAAHGSNLPVVIKSDAIINNTRYADSALIYISGTMPDNGVMFFVASLGTIQLQILSNDDGETWNAYAIS